MKLMKSNLAHILIFTLFAIATIAVVAYTNAKAKETTSTKAIPTVEIFTKDNSLYDVYYHGEVFACDINKNELDTILTYEFQLK